MSVSFKYQSLTTIFLLLFIMGLNTAPSKAYAQNDPELIAKNLFREGNYPEALPYFKDLAKLYPEDAMINYYFAACLVETKVFNEETKTVLQNASSDEVPAKIFYYLGQFSHANNDFDKAINFYNRFKKEAKKKTLKETKIEEFLKLCDQSINPFPKPETKEPAIEEQPIKEAQEEELIKIPHDLASSSINFQVTPTIKYLNIDQFKEQTSLQAFVQAWIQEKEIEKLLSKTKSLRAKYDTVQEDEKEELAAMIIQLEKETYQLNQKVNNNFYKAREKEITYWEQADPDETTEFAKHIQFMEDSIHKVNQPRNIAESSATQILELPEQAIDEMLPETINETQTEVIYKIQIGAYKRNPPEWVQKLYKKLSIIRKIDQYTDDKGVTVYTVGELSSFDDAMQMQSQVRTEGVKDAFVAAYKNGERISVKEAQKLTETGG